MNPAASPSSPSSNADNDATSATPTGAIRTQSRSSKKAPGTIAKRACDQCKFRKIKVIWPFPYSGDMIGANISTVQSVTTMSRMCFNGLRMHLFPASEEARSDWTVSEITSKY